MDAVEAVMLTRYVRAICPQQKFDEYTADAWHDVLVPYNLEECRTAAATIAKRQPFVAPSEIVTEVERVRTQRLDGYVYSTPNPNETGAEYIRRRRAQLAAVAAGQAPPGIAAPEILRPRPVAELVAGVAGARQLPPEIADILGKRRPAAHMVRCPWEPCRAREGLPCTDMNGRPRTTPHPSRVDAWAVSVAGCPVCHAAMRAPCRDTSTGSVRTDGAHPERLAAAKESA